MLTPNRKLDYSGSAPDRKVRRYIKPARIVRIVGNVENSAVLTDQLTIQSYLHFNAPFAQLAPGSEVIVDFGCELHGGVRIVTAHCGLKQLQVRLTFGESVSETLGTPTTDHAVHQAMLDVPPMGMAEFGNTAFRFVRLELPADAEGALDLMGLTAVANYLDLAYLGSFECDDERLNQIWFTGAYTVHLNMQDYIYDGAKRDRFVWMGDLYPEVRVIASVFDDIDLVEKSLDFMRDHTPAGEWMNGISSYTAWWVICHADWYLWRGDRAYLESQRTALIAQLDMLIAAVGADGREKMPDVRFLDWPNNNNPAATGAGLQGLLAWSLEAGAKLMAWLGESAKAAECAAKAESLRGNAPPVGLNKTAAAMQVLGGILDPKQADKDVFSVDPVRGVSTFYGYFVLLARAMGGDIAGALEVIRRYWGTMLDYGATTFWEDFDLDWVKNACGIDEIPVAGKDDLHADFGNYCYVGLRHSLCHGWAGGPTAFLSEQVLGIAPLAPGFERFSCKPTPAGLKWFKGTVPTPKGLIGVAYVDGKVTLEIPAGCTAVLADGRELTAGKHSIAGLC